MEEWIEKLEGAPLPVIDAFQKATAVVNSQQYEAGKILCSVSGGADSDVMLDLLTKVDHDRKIRYLFFNTGIEYRATLDHLDELEAKYGIEIIRRRAIKSIPVCAREYGEPIFSKQISEFMSRLQKHGFRWEDEPLDVLEERYPKCRAALRWWCNDFSVDGKPSRFDIAYKKGLKDFILQNPPDFKISALCCQYAKKDVAAQAAKEYEAQLEIIGVRRAEGGARATAYKSCFSYGTKHGTDQYRPLFWFTDEDKRWYEERFEVAHSKCYSEYGLRRTGCTGCPFARDIFAELNNVGDAEVGVVQAARTIFKNAYAYTEAYKDFVDKM